MAKISVLLKCPKCKMPVTAETKKVLKYFLYRCKCGSNVVFYDKKIDIISDNMVKYLKKSGLMEFCGEATFSQTPQKRVKTTVKATTFKKPPSRGLITKDQVTNFKILLETSGDFDDFISKI